ncbi:MAG: radical SAM protein [Heliobacteriaceae bacterium]|jgi:MoaA/NifB/PqqE/SkfB family radical SAM enzyme|nr:radical SAM protein [Heliobacteriaceae bacterium]
MTDKILVSTDLLRPLMWDGKLDYFHKIRLNKYRHFLQYPLSAAVNPPVEPLSPYNTDFNFNEFYKLCGLELKNELSWLEIYDLQDIPDAAVEYYKKYIDNSLVIYHEAPNIYKIIHNKLNIPYIDLNVHPVRFLDDNFWGIKTNSRQIFDKIKKYQTDEEMFYIYAGMHRAGFDLKPADIKPNSVLFAGQTNVDKSLYSSGKILSIYDFKDKIEEFGEKYNKVYYKPHPYNYDLDKILEFLKQYPFVEITNENIYKILSNDNLSKICAITSGSLYEAKYFGKEAVFLAPPYLHFDYSKDCPFSENTCLSIYDEFIYPHFWADVLQDVVSVKTPAKITLPPRANRIRAAFDDYWSATDLDPAIKLADKKYGPAFSQISHVNGLQWQEIEKLKYNLSKHIKSVKKFIRKYGSRMIICPGRFGISYKKAPKKTLYNNPHSLIIDTTILCNNCCSFCWRKNYPDYLEKINQKYSKNHTMDFKTYKKIVDDAVQYDSIRWFSLCGPMGDPMLNPNIEKFYEYANSKKHFKTIALNTNGLAADKHDIGGLLNNITEFSISVDSINPDTYGKIHGSGKYLTTVIENIKKLIACKKEHGALADIVVRFTENELNYGEFREFEKYFSELGVDRINYTKMHGFAGVHKNMRNNDNASRCQQLLGAVNFNFKGDMTTCCVNWKIEPAFGNIKNKTIKQMWNGHLMKKWLKNQLNTEPCKDCSGIGEHVQKQGLSIN